MLSAVLLTIVGTSPAVAQPIATDTVTGLSKPLSVAVSPDSSRAYVMDNAGDRVVVIDTATNSHVGSYPVQDPFAGVVVTRNGVDYLYVGSYMDSAVKVINTATGAMTASVSGISSPYFMAATPNGNFVYVPSMDTSKVAVINTTTNTLVTNIPVGSLPITVAISPDGLRAYVANYAKDTISVISTVTKLVLDTINVGAGAGPYGLAVSPDSSTLYASLETMSAVVRFNTATNTMKGLPIAVGLTPRGITLAPDGAHVYVANFTDNTVSRIATATNTVTEAPIAVGQHPAMVALAPDGHHAYVPNYEGGSVSVLALTLPGAPTGVTGTAGDSQITATWTAPASAAPITEYRATVTPGGQTCVTSDVSCVIGGLTNGTAYQVTVTATSGVGTGPASSPSAAITPAAKTPDTPTLLAQVPANSKGIPPARIKKKGVTVLVGPNATTNAGQPIHSRVKVKAKHHKPKISVTPKGKVTIRTFGRPYALVLTQSAPETSRYAPYSARTSYKNGKRQAETPTD